VSRYRTLKTEGSGFYLNTTNRLPRNEVRGQEQSPEAKLCYSSVCSHVSFEQEKGVATTSTARTIAYRTKTQLPLNILGITHVTSWRRVLIQKLIVALLAKKFPVFYRKQNSLPCSLQPATWPSPEPAESSPHSHTYYLNIAAKFFVQHMNINKAAKPATCHVRLKRNLDVALNFNLQSNRQFKKTYKSQVHNV
jgi:hypothetical protein